VTLRTVTIKSNQRLRSVRGRVKGAPLSKNFVVSVAEVDRGEVEKSWPLTHAWLQWALEGTEAVPGEEAGRLDVSLTRTGRDYVVLGRCTAEVVFRCARTMEPAPYSLSADLTLLLRRGANAEQPNKAPSRSERHRTRAQKKAEPDVELSDDDVAADTFTGDQIVLDEFVREQLLLEFPMFPLRSDLRSAASAAIGPAPENPEADEPQVLGSKPTESDVAERETLDPRLAPLLDIANELAAKLKKGSS
jgi:uncharacterized metal-binding protein YceD (DUF177 family)